VGGRDGGLQFRRDVYGRDAKVLAALDAEFRFGTAAKRYAPSSRR
jgi:murein L,D-transpeptidase YcbB/YkuD